MTDATDRSAVTLDRRAKERRVESKAIDFADRRISSRRNRARRQSNRRSETAERRSVERRADEIDEIIVTDKDIQIFESPPPSPMGLLSTVLLILGLLVLLTQL